MLGGRSNGLGSKRGYLDAHDARFLIKERLPIGSLLGQPTTWACLLHKERRRSGKLTLETAPCRLEDVAE